MNEVLVKFARDYLKENLKRLSPEQILLFKRLYSNDNLEREFYDVVDSISEEKLDWAMQQVINTLKRG